MDQEQKADLAQIIAKGMRRASVYTLVFGGLLGFTHREEPSLSRTVLVVGIGATLFILGLILEMNRRARARSTPR